jgi:hypothetical protein
MTNRFVPVIALAISTCHLLAAARAAELTPGEAPVITTQGVLPAPESTVTAAVERWQLLIRRSFSSRVQEQRPATLTFETAGEGRNDYHIDVAVGRYFKSENLSISPSIEWHRRSLDSVDRNRLSGAVTTDWTLKSSPSFTPLIRGRAELGRDVANSITTSTASLLASGFIPNGDSSGSSLTYHGIYKGTFYPYAGLEYFHNQPIGELASVSTTMVMAMVEAKVAPLNGSAKGIDSALEINGSYAFRKPLNHDGLRTRYQLLKLDVNLYLDAPHHLALGFEYQNGQDPDEHLAGGHSGLVALRFKL